MKTLIIGNGESANPKNVLKIVGDKKYHEIIICNKGFLAYDKIATRHVIAEKTSKDNGYDAAKILNKGKYRIDLVRYINFKGINFYDGRFNIIPIKRHYSEPFDPLKPIQIEGLDPNAPILFAGPVDVETNLALGTCLLQAIHLASILGTTEIDLIGADLCFKHPDRDHFWNDGKFFRNKWHIANKKNRPKPIKIGKTETTNYFYNSAIYLNDNLQRLFPHIKFVDYSDGLLKLK